jgi:hypothetical protein
MAARSIAFGFKAFFSSAKLDFLVILILWLCQIQLIITTRFAEYHQYVWFLDFIAGFQFLRVLRLTKLLSQNERLSMLFATVEISLPQAKNISVIMGLVLYIYGVTGMKIYGNVCNPDNPPEDDSVGDGICITIGERFNFWDISSSMSLMFQLATGFDSADLMKDINAETDGKIVFMFFVSFYVMSNYVLLNLFIAVLLENFELGVSADKFELSKADIEDFKNMWDADGNTLAHGIHIRKLKHFVKTLTGCFSLITQDPCWYNRLLIELQTDTKHELDGKSRISFSELILALCLLRFGSSMLDFDAKLKVSERVESKRQDYANRMLLVAVRARATCSPLLVISSTSDLIY